MAQTAQADLKAVGINAKTKIATVEVFIDDAYNGNPPPMVTYLWDLPYPHGSYFFDGAFTEAAIEANCCNLSMWSDPTFEEADQGRARRRRIETEIVDLYKQMDKTVVLDEVAAVPMILDVRVDFASKRVQGRLRSDDTDNGVVLQGLLAAGSLSRHRTAPLSTGRGSLRPEERSGWTIVVLWAIATLTFGAIFLSPIDPAHLYAGARAPRAGRGTGARADFGLNDS